MHGVLGKAVECCVEYWNDAMRQALERRVGCWNGAHGVLELNIDLSVLASIM